MLNEFFAGVMVVTAKNGWVLPSASKAALTAKGFAATYLPFLPPSATKTSIVATSLPSGTMPPLLASESTGSSSFLWFLKGSPATQGSIARFAPWGTKGGVLAKEGGSYSASLSTGGSSLGQTIADYATSFSNVALQNIIPFVGGGAAGGVAGLQVEKSRQEKEKSHLREALSAAQKQLQEAEMVREQLAVAEGKIAQLQAEKNVTTDMKDEVPQVAQAVEASSEEVEPPVPDDLTRISGIGKTYAGRLNEAGIFTFAQLAALEPEQIFEIVSTGHDSTLIHTDSWVAQARQFAGISEPEEAESE